MRLVIGDAKQFKQCIEAVVNLVDEGSFEISKDGIHLRAMDPSQIAMVDFTLPAKAFTELDAGESVALSLNLADFLKILSRARGDEQLALSLEERESKCLLEFSGPGGKRSVRLPLTELNLTTPREPKVTFDATLKLRGGTFKEMLKDAGLLSSHVVLSASPELFVIEAKGDSGDLKIETKKDSAHFVELSTQSKARAMYPFEYLDNITKSCPEDSIIQVQLKNDAPVKISYSVGQASLTYYLAPRVES